MFLTGKIFFPSIGQEALLPKIPTTHSWRLSGAHGRAPQTKVSEIGVLFELVCVSAWSLMTSTSPSAHGPCLACSGLPSHTGGAHTKKSTSFGFWRHKEVPFTFTPFKFVQCVHSFTHHWSEECGEFGNSCVHSGPNRDKGSSCTQTEGLLLPSSPDFPWRSQSARNLHCPH